MSEKRGSNKLVVILLSITLVVLIATAGILGYFFVFKGNNSSSKSASNSAVMDVKTVALDEFIVNLADEGKTFIKIKIVLAYTDKKLDKELANTTKVSQIRDTAISTLRKKTSANFSNGGEDAIKKELVEKINSVLDAGKLTNIYFYDIVIQ